MARALSRDFLCAGKGVEACASAQPVRSPRASRLRLTPGKCFLFSVLLLSTLPLPGADGNWFAQVWRSDDGLPDNSVTGIGQTADGYLWVATTAGLARFDGVQFQEFNPVRLSDVPNRVISAMFLDRHDRMWLAMDRGPVARVAAKTARVFTGNGFPDMPPTVMTEDGAGAVWIAYERGDITEIVDDRVVQHGIGRGLPGSGPVWLATDAEGQLWFAQSGSIGKYQQGQFTVLLTLPERTVHIAAARGGGVWLVTGSRVLRFREGHPVKERVRLPEVVPTALLEDRSGSLWFGTADRGLFRYDGFRLETMPTSHKSISYLMQDRQGNLWVGTSGGGLNRLRPRVVELIDAAVGLPFDSVRSVTEDRQGWLWAVGQNGLLARRQRDGWKVLQRTGPWPGSDAMTVAGDASGGVWIGTAGHGLFHYQDGRFRVWRKRDGLAGEVVHSLLVASNGDVWLSTDSPHKLQRLRASQWRTFAVPPGARDLRAMAEGRNGDVWVGTSDGQLLRIGGDALVDETVRVQSRTRSIRCLHVTPDGTLWIGYADAGVGRWKDGNYNRISTAQGLWEDNISQIADDGTEHLWLAGNHGIFRVGLGEINAVAEGRLPRVHSVAYRRSEGLPSVQGSYTNAPGALRSRDGSIWLATRAGLALVHPGGDTHTTPLPVVLEQVTLDGNIAARQDSGFPLLPPNLRDLPGIGGELVLPPDHRKIEFKFTALNLSSPESIHFRYRLEGFDDDWVETGEQRSATYTRLNSGNYRFRVAARDNAGVWNEAGADIRLKVARFFWQTWWFRSAALAGLILLIAVIVRYLLLRRYRQRLRTLKQQAALSQERARIAQDLHDDLGATLTQATLLLELADGAGGDSHVHEGLATVRRAIKSLDETVWAVNPRNNTLAELIAYIGQYAVEFLQPAGIRCRLELPDHPPDAPVTFELRHDLLLTVKEALNNVVRHAHAGEVCLQVAVNESHLRLVIVDNGCGFEQLPENGLADGVRNMRQRAEKLQGEFTIESRPGMGTTVTVVYAWRSNGARGLDSLGNVEGGRS